MEENKANVEEEVLETNAEEVNADNSTDEVEAEVDTVSTDDEAPLKHKDKKKLKKAEAEIETLKSQLAEEQEKYMRLYAEYDNFRRRSAKERDGIYADAYSDAIQQILPIIDNIERAVQYSQDDPESAMAKGIELTIKSCIEALNKMGVYEIEALGKPFDPNFHNAVMHVEDESFGENEIVEVFMKGYVRGDKVLRFSMVKVAN
ncbi:MAG: nucleotide exchange factor GrpE [Ruminococcaceae bacterium]|nr:nucleotide exchange factor GrpE [Oscillospiraceae bacterium]